MHDMTRSSKPVEYAVYADLARPLTPEERSSVFEALDANVPGSGCVGPHKSGNDEVYFAVEACSEEEASALAARHMNLVLREAGLNTDYAVTVQRMPQR